MPAVPVLMSVPAFEQACGGVAVAVFVGVAVSVDVGVFVAVGVSVTVGVSVAVLVAVAVGVGVAGVGQPATGAVRNGIASIVEAESIWSPPPGGFGPVALPHQLFSASTGVPTVPDVCMPNVVLPAMQLLLKTLLAGLPAVKSTSIP